MALKALIFDVDGTLAETEKVHLQAFNAGFKTAGLLWKWDEKLYRELLKTTGGKERLRTYLGKYLGENLEAWPGKITRIHGLKTRYYVNIVQSGALELRPGIQSLIDEARDAGLALALATTTTLANVQALCQSVWGKDMEDLFSVIAAGDEVGRKKPTPDVFKLALERLGLQPEECIGFEDSYNGMLSSLAADLTTVVVPSYFMDDADFSAAHLYSDCYTKIRLAHLHALCPLDF
ncbi:MAG: HAD-IA family hydrolase [Robiginitomaculum sp.]